MSDELYRIRSYMLKQKQEKAGEQKTLLQRRAEMDGAMVATARLPEGAVEEETEVAGMPALWVRAAGVPREGGGTVLYYHGGGFFCGSPATHRGMAGAISVASGAGVLLPGYRLAPEHLYPAAHEDALAAYRWLRNSGVPAEKIMLGGDSAGGMLVLSTLLALRDAGEALPAAAFMLSPWLDIVDFNSESYTSCAALDPMVDRESSMLEAENYFGSIEKRRSISPLQKDPKGLPKLLVQVGDQEVLLGDSLTLAEKARAAGVDVQLEVWPELWHIFQALTGILPEAREAMAHIGEFVKAHFANP